MIPLVTASETGKAHPESLEINFSCGVVGFRLNLVRLSARLSLLEWSTIEGESPVCLVGFNA